MKKHYLRLLNLILLPVDLCYAVSFIVFIAITGLIDSDPIEDEGEI